jgi:hypothetical protein
MKDKSKEELKIWYKSILDELQNRIPNTTFPKNNIDQSIYDKKAP